MTTLRQAHKLVDNLNALIKSIDLSSVVSFNIWEIDNPETVFDAAISEFNNNLDRAIRLVAARNTIRQRIGIANAAEINDIITQRKAVMDHQSVLARVIENSENAGRSRMVNSPRGFIAKLDQLRTKERTGYGDDNIITSVLTQEQVDGIKAIINQQQRSVDFLEEQLLTLNVNTTISLDSVTQSVLLAEKMI